MKKLLQTLSIVALSLFITVGGLSTSAHAINAYTKFDDIVSSKDILSHSFLVAGDRVTSNDQVDGLLFSLGSQLAINGQTEYGLIAGEQVNISGVVAKDLFAIGRNINLAKEASLGRDAFLAASNIDILTDIKGNLFAASETLYLDNVTIDGDAKLSCAQITFGENVDIKGKLTYNANAKISGLEGITTGETETTHQPATKTPNFGSRLLEKIISTSILIVTAIILGALFPKCLATILKDPLTTRHLTKSFFIGLGLLVLVPITCIVVMITTLGLPLGLIGLALYATFLYLGTATSGLQFGHLFLTKLFHVKWSASLELIIGTLLISIISLIPVLGEVVAIIATVYGFGVLCQLLAKAKR